MLHLYEALEMSGHAVLEKLRDEASSPLKLEVLIRYPKLDGLVGFLLTSWELTYPLSFKALLMMIFLFP